MPARYLSLKSSLSRSPIHSALAVDGVGMGTMMLCFFVKRYLRKPKIEKPNLTPLQTNQLLYSACAITSKAFGLFSL